MKNKSLALKVNCEPSTGNCGAGCYFQYVYFKAKKRVYSEPKPGDKVIFGTALKKDHIKHIGLVIAVSGNKITTIEGNKSNSVKKCTYTLGAKGSKILAFLRPLYDDIVTAKRVIAYAKTQVGYKETGNNHNKYSKLLDSIDYYNTKKDPVCADWCAIFTDACIYECTDNPKEEKPKEEKPANVKPVPAKSFKKALAKTYVTRFSTRLLAAPARDMITKIPMGTSVKCYGYYTGSYLYVTYGKLEGYVNFVDLR